jgi:hypothetical protein
MGAICGLCGMRLHDGIGHVCTHYMLPIDEKADQMASLLMAAARAKLPVRKLVPKPDSLDTLATNLRWAAALTKSFTLGTWRGGFPQLGEHDDRWSPGSNKPAPGWG